MPTNCIAFRETKYFSNLICDYLDENPSLNALYNRFPKLENFEAQITDKQNSYPKTSRVVLKKVLQQQYRNTNTSVATQTHIEQLEHDNTFTITTGHQLNLFTGPLYFLYKIVSTINLTHQLKAAYPKFNFVPIYWMASEDHDFDEINYFNFKNKKIKWQRDASGAVGELSTKNLKVVYDALSLALGQGINANDLKQLFAQAYLQHDNLADATRYIANTLFANEGLVVIDANHTDLKRLFIPFITQDIIDNISYKEVTKTCETIAGLGYKVQVNPRAINLFYITKGLRERIVFENEKYNVLNTTISWTKTEILAMVNEFPERFSPNVIMRPLYQEVILPNLCYIGGGGELAYWLEFKSFFKAVAIPLPILLLRNSVLIKTKKESKKQAELHLSLHDLFLKQDELLNKQTKTLSPIKIDLSAEKELLKNQFKRLFSLAEKTDKSFLGAVAAQEKKQLKGLSKLEKRLLKAQKRQLSQQLDRVTKLQNQLFPNQSLQERQINFSEIYLEFGDRLIAKLLEELKPLSNKFVVLEF